MEEKKVKTNGGACCAVVSCSNNYYKAKSDGKSNLSFHRFPKDLNLQKQWIIRCKREDIFNPYTSFVCSEHLTADAFVVQGAEGYISKRQRLKNNAIPLLNLTDIKYYNIATSTSTVDRRSRMEIKTIKLTNNDIMSSALYTNEPSPPNLLSTRNIDDLTRLVNMELNLDYEQMYTKLIEEYETLKIRNRVLEEEIISIKKSDVDHQKAIESLRLSINFLNNNLKKTQLLLIQSQKTTTKQIKSLSLNKTQNIENRASKRFRPINSKEK